MQRFQKALKFGFRFLETGLKRRTNEGLSLLEVSFVTSTRLKCTQQQVEISFSRTGRKWGSRTLNKHSKNVSYT